MKRLLFPYFGAFLAGSTLYPIIEILFRGYTHPSMSLLGGLCAMAILWVDALLGRIRLIWKALVSSVIITQLELICGLLVNRHWNLHVWDYSHLPGNLAGQICPLFTFFWFLLSFCALHFFRFFRKLAPYIFPRIANNRKLSS